MSKHDGLGASGWLDRLPMKERKKIMKRNWRARKKAERIHEARNRRLRKEQAGSLALVIAERRFSAALAIRRKAP